MTTTIKVKGMSCQHCVASVTNALSAIDGISDVQVDLDKGIAVFQEDVPIDPETIKKAIAATGFEVVDE
jgi:copper chaperone